MDTKARQHEHHETSSGGTIPDLERLCYFFGQMLEPADFRAEQRYFMTLLSLLGRHTAGWGVVCGLDVRVEPGSSAGCEDQPEHERLEFTVTRGIALDCRGRLIVLRKDYQCRLAGLLGVAEREALLEGKPLYVSIHHLERHVRPSRGLGDGCDPLVSMQYGRIRDEARVVVSLERPAHTTCDTCLDACSDSRVLLASIHLVDPGRSATVEVRTELRRLLARHELTTITDLGWVHGGSYSRRNAEQLLKDGFGLRFSRPVKAATLQDGVVDLMIYEGGSGRRDDVYVKAVELSFDSAEDLVSKVVMMVSQPEGFQVGDRIHLSVRCDFILDECCRAVSGAHLGGGVRFDRALAKGEAAHPEPAKLPCPSPPDHSGRWRSGNGVEGGVFESWIKVVSDTAGYGTAEGRAQ
jgi:hypothetical protein